MKYQTEARKIIAAYIEERLLNTPGARELGKTPEESKALYFAIRDEVDRLRFGSSKPHLAGKASRISEAQRAILSRIKYEGEYRYPKETPTIKALLKKGLMSGRWQPPAPGNDYGGTMVYTLTQAGRAVLEAAS